MKAGLLTLLWVLMMGVCHVTATYSRICHAGTVYNPVGTCGKNLAKVLSDICEGKYMQGKRAELSGRPILQIFLQITCISQYIAKRLVEDFCCSSFSCQQSHRAVQSWGGGGFRGFRRPCITFLDALALHCLCVM